ncbi:hypothetical protein B6S44_07980 [Bosea sp. Tri-44]|nr:hypothetical protein B6S44_07980 [Bosea sp. Tri-44]
MSDAAMPATASGADRIDRLRALLGTSAILGPAELEGRDAGWDAANFNAFALARPSSTAAVARLLAWCADEGIVVVPQGGRTGLVGGAVSSPDALICDLGGLAAIEEIDAETGIAVVQAGITLAALQQATNAIGLDPGIDLAARGSATIGGMVSTNAGGIMAFRAGVMRHRVLGLEVVLPDGRIFSDMTRVIKTSAGYDLKHLFIGAEGTLGVVTRVVLKLEPVVAARATALVAIADAQMGLAIVRHLQTRLPGRLRAAEIMWRTFVAATGAALGFDVSQSPFDAPCVLGLEIAGEDFDEAASALENGLAEIYDELDIEGCVVATSLQQAERLWSVRERTEILYRLHPRAPSFDVSVAGGAIDVYLSRTLADLRLIDPEIEPYVFGHLADGNLHIVLNLPGPLDEAMQEDVERAIYQDLAAMGGSLSAEHGIGLTKRAAFERYADPVKQQLTAAIKNLLDPTGICNPGKILDTKLVL